MVGIFVTVIQDAFEKIATEQMQDRLLTTARVNTQNAAGSAYDLGIDFTQVRDIYGIVSYIPICIATSFYRPFPWENFSAKTILTILENLLLLCMTLLAIYKSRFNFILKSITNPLLLLCLGLSITIGIISGFTSGNFGTLVRYRMPLLPYLVLFLLIHIHHQYKIHFQNK
jgi:hypothetical protein